MFKSFLGTGFRRAFILSTLINIGIFILGWPLFSIGLIPGFLAGFYSDIVFNSIFQLVILVFIIWYFSKKEEDTNLLNLKREVENISRQKPENNLEN